MWPGGELPVCRSGQQETRAWCGGAAMGFGARRRSGRSGNLCLLATGAGEQGAGAGTECKEGLSKAGERWR